MTDKLNSAEEAEPNEKSAQELQQKAQWLTKKIEDALEHTRRTKRKNRQRASYVRVVTIALSGLATILLGLQIVGFEKYFKEIAFVLGALVTLLNALEPFFNFRALWVEHERAQANFHRLKDKIGFYLVGTDVEKLSLEKLEALHNEYQMIWTRLSGAWIEYRRGYEAE